MTYRIKPLVWTRENGDGESWIACTEHGAYVVWIYGGLTRMITPFGGRPSVSSIAHGQQLAWEDWRARILPALEEVPEPINQGMLDALHHVALQFGGQRPGEGCDCPDCTLLRPVLAAITEAERGRE